MKLKHIVILQNKIDLVKRSQGKEQFQQIMKFIEGTVAPVIPISALLKYSFKVLCEYICKKILIPNAYLFLRSKQEPGSEFDGLKGGAAFGSILTGVLKVGMEIEV
ncbi:unnamed protein product [Notodromas monacha]|uniref:Uncharacterized protein n=1 Tax=Notodromas monacha TaxID=399045 RepID=A0A7R9GHR6_9CRUS|nr:unnamed protein product [Notodromas monacha]CAG0923094.1 unnamed protein product [Notodromas monacha]